MPRTQMQASLHYYTARELVQFLWRAIREENKSELRTLKSEFDRRGKRLSTEQYGGYIRVMRQGATT